MNFLRTSGESQTGFNGLYAKIISPLAYAIITGRTCQALSVSNPIALDQCGLVAIVVNCYGVSGPQRGQRLSSRREEPNGCCGQRKNEEQGL
jgi:hypothetical protein